MIRACWRRFVHRWTRGQDIAALLDILRRMLDTAGSIEGFFLEGDDPAAPDVGPGLESFCARARDVDLRPVYGRRMAARPGAHAFFPRPSAGSACKRLNLFLRWMVRRDGIDLGDVDARVTGAPHHPPRRARDQGGAVSRADAARVAGLAHGGVHHGLTAAD